MCITDRTKANAEKLLIQRTSMLNNPNEFNPPTVMGYEGC